MGTAQQSAANGDKFEARYSGTYYSAGVNAAGEGVKSEGIVVTIKTCPALPSKPTISLNPTDGKNICLDTIVRLTASVNSGTVTSYSWYKDNKFLMETTVKTLVVSEAGSYHVVANNASGSSEPSAVKTVTIVSCQPTAPTDVSTNYSSIPYEISVRWGKSPLATSYRIYVCDNAAMSVCENSYTEVSASVSSCPFSSDELLCRPINYFKVVAINSFGSAESGVVSQPRVDNNNLTSSPTIYSVESSLGKVTIKWYKDGGSYYEILRRLSVGAYEIIQTELTATSCVDVLPAEYTGVVTYKVRTYVYRCGERGAQIDSAEKPLTVY